MDKVTADTSHLESVKAQLGTNDFHAFSADAQQHQDAEHTMTLREAVKRYPKAIMWSVILSCAIIMEGFDLVLLSSLFAQPQFQRKYGVPLNDGTGNYTIESKWQIGLNLAVQAGSIMGLLVNGWASERFGYRKTICSALVLMIAVIFIPFFAQDIKTLFAGQLLAGIPWGIFQTLSTAYASEVVPVCLRHYLTAYVNLCWVMGQLIASGVLRGVLNWQAEWAFRVPFALQWLWPPLILIPCLFAPDSPWWLVRKGRLDQARVAIRKLRTNPTEAEIEQQIAFMQHTNELEKSVAEGTSYLACFRGVDLRRTEVAAGAWVAQNWCGSAFMGYSTYFLERAGLDTSHAFSMSIGQYALGAVGTVTSWFLMTYIGRRKLYLTGFGVQTVLLLIIGGLGFASQSSMGPSWGIGALLLIYTAVYDATVGPVCYSIVAECSSTRLRAKTVVIARICYNIAGVVNQVKMPYFLNPDELNWGGKTGLYWGGFCFLCFVWTYFRVPEMKGRTYGELEVLFESRVSARKFASTHVDQFAGTREVAGERFVVKGETADKEKKGQDITMIDSA